MADRFDLLPVDVAANMTVPRSISLIGRDELNTVMALSHA